MSLTNCLLFQVRTQFSIFVVLASPLIISGSIIHMTPTDLATYTNPKAISISQVRISMENHHFPT